MHKQPIGMRNDRSHNLEVGDRVYTWVKFNETVIMDDLVESNGKNKAAMGELTPMRVAKNGQCRIAVIMSGVWYWVD